MGFELPAVSAVMARLPDPTVSLAAYGGVVFPLALLIEGPIVMLLAASTALSKDRQSYELMRRFMLISGVALTALHMLVAFTPLYYPIVGTILGAPEEILEPGRIGMQLMTPWTMSIAYRRFQQGVLIRFGHSGAVGIGTLIRLGGNGLVLLIGYLIGSISGIVVGCVAVSVGVIGEAVYAGYRVHPVIRDQLRRATPLSNPLTLRAFLRFYSPLMVTPVLMFLGMPMASAAMSRMPNAIESLAIWPVINGVVFAFRSVGFALNEVVVSLLEKPGALAALQRFTLILAVGMSLFLVVLAATPLGNFWFGTISALEPRLVALGMVGLWLSMLLPGLTAMQSLYQGAIVHSHRTRGITESMIVYLVTISAALIAGIAQSRLPGIYVAIIAMVIGNAAQLLWLMVRSRGIMTEIRSRDAGVFPWLDGRSPALIQG